MSLVVLQQADLCFGNKTIFSELDLRIGSGDRIGLVGPNGSGKSSLMRILAQQQEPDSGSVGRCRGLKVGYLSQDLDFPVEDTLAGYVLCSVPGRGELDREVAAAEAELAAFGKDDEDVERMMELAQRLADLHEKLTHFETHYSEHEAFAILAGLGFETRDHNRPLGEFSGGWKMRAVLAALLFQRPDLLLLDEPTNHLDMPSVAWFGDFLKRYNGSFVLVCHDREFLNEQIERVVSFESEGVRQYRGNYEHYRKQRKEEEIVLLNKAKNTEREREKAEQFIERFRAQATKAKAVQSRVKALQKLNEVATFKPRRVMTFSFPECARTGDEVLRVEGLSKSYGDKKVISNVNLEVKRGEKIGIIGVNGAGKTTLLKMLAGELETSSGAVSLGRHVTPGYYAQHHADALHPEATLYNEVASREPEAGQTRVRTILGTFLFSGDEVDKKVRVLSGGERARVALAQLLIKPGNLLLMDEPTNHLDLESSETLAQSLSTYDGTLIFVSHNRSFVRTLADRIWDVSDGTVRTYPGNLDEYLAQSGIISEKVPNVEEGNSSLSITHSPPALSAPSEPPAQQSDVVADTSERPRSREEQKEKKRQEAEVRALYRKAIGPLEKRVQSLEKQIAAVETVQKKCSSDLAAPAIYDNEPRRNELLNDYRTNTDKLDSLNEQWELAASELERAQEEFESSESSSQV